MTSLKQLNLIQKSTVSSRHRRQWLLPLLALLILPALSCSDEEEEPVEITPDDPEALCVRDEINEPSQAQNLAFGETIEGYLCPQEDRDWYRIDVPPSDTIIKINLSLPGMSPVQPTYNIFTVENGEPGELVAAPPATEIGVNLEYVHCVDPGTYLAVVRDDGDDAQDFRNTYDFEIQSVPDPDTNEPNESDTEAISLTSGTKVTAAISCRGDQDWYSVTATAGQLLDIWLTSAVTAYEPRLRVFDAEGMLLAEDANHAGQTAVTDLRMYKVLPGAGTFFVAVTDGSRNPITPTDDDQDATPDVTYDLTVTLVTDRDPNEPNNTPEEATPIAGGSSMGCGGSWSAWQTHSGTIGSPGDTDWFEVPLDSGCEGGIIEAEVTMDTASLPVAQQWEFNSHVQANVELLRGHTESTCDIDQVCGTLNIGCSMDDSYEFGINGSCSPFSSTCIQTGGGSSLCSGAMVCLPGGTCAGVQTNRSYSCPANINECRPASGSSPPPNQARFAAPLLGGNSVVYLRVTDFQSNGADPDTMYTLRVRTRGDTDGGREPDNTYFNQLPTELPGDNDMSTTIDVHDCTSGVDCCGSGDWVTGTIGYQNDVDWFQYQHPCPESDCTLRVHYQVDEGPVDTRIEIFRGNRRFITILDADQETHQAAASGATGGLTAADECVYAYSNHSGYNIVVRDVFELYENTTIVRSDSRDYSADQTYRFCVEKVSNVCAEPPCQIHDNGCGPPR